MRDSNKSQNMSRRGKQQQIFLSVPVEIHFRPTWGSYRKNFVSIEDRTARLVFRPGLKYRNEFLNDADSPPDEVDPWDARDDFLNDLNEAQGFHEYESLTFWYGQFGRDSADLQFKVPEKGRPIHVITAMEAEEQDVREWYELLRTAMTMPMNEWPSLADKFPARKVNILLQPLPITLEWREGKPVGTMVLCTLIDAGCPRSRAFRDLGFYGRDNLGVL